MKITIERPLTDEELKVVENLLKAKSNREDKKDDKKDDKKTCKKEDDFELWFF